MKTAACCFVFLGLIAFAEEPKNLLKPINKLDSWRFEKADGGDGSMKVEEDTIVFTTTKITGSDWHVQAVQTGLDLKDGQRYTLKFKVKADSSISIGVNAMIDQDDWHQVGLGEQIFVNKNWQDCEFTFQAENTVAKKNRISVVLGFDTGTVTIKDMTLTAK